MCSINSTGDISLFFIKDISSVADRFFKLPNKDINYLNNNYFSFFLINVSFISLKYQIINKDIKTVNTLDISEWEFFVLPTKVLDQREQSEHSITLSSLIKITISVSFKELRSSFEDASTQTSFQSTKIKIIPH